MYFFNHELDAFMMIKRWIYKVKKDLFKKKT